MWTSIPKILMRRVFRPPLRLVFELILAQFALWLFAKLREFFSSWQFEEEKSARTEKQRETIRNKYERREADLAKIEKEIPEKIHEIVRGVLQQADRQRPLVVGQSAEAFTVKRAQRRRRKVR